MKEIPHHQSEFIKNPYFLFTVTAPSAEQAFRDSGLAKYRRRFLLCHDTIELVRQAVRAKQKRVLENAALYGDKALEYEGILQRIAARGSDPTAVATAMLEHGDSRCDVRDACCIMQAGHTQWLVFGYVWS